jgi:peptide/nickel transport system substrate-binding protein
MTHDIHFPKTRGVMIAACALLALGSSVHAEADPGKRGGVLNIGLASQAECLDPQQHQHGFDSQQGRALVDSLTDQSQKDAGTIVAWLPTSWQISDDATQYTFLLRDDVTFSDGTKLDASVVKANFDALKAIPAAAGAEYLTAVKEIAVVDPLTVKISFSEPNIAFLAATATTRLGIVSAATAAKSSDERCKEGIVGSGPFVIERHVYNEELVLARRQGYNWASSVVKHQGEAYLDKVVYKVIPEASVRTGALTSGQVDITAASYQDADALKDGGFNIINASYVGTSAALFFNIARPLAGDIAVRRALLHAVDTREIVQLVQNGYVEAARGLLTPITPGFLDQSAEIAFDPDASRKILDDAGWIPGSDGIRVKDGQRLSLIGAFWANPTNRLLFEVIQQQAAAVGIEVQINPEPSSPAYLQGQIDGKYDFFRWHWSLADAPHLGTPDADGQRSLCGAPGAARDADPPTHQRTQHREEPPAVRLDRARVGPVGADVRVPVQQRLPGHAHPAEPQPAVVHAHPIERLHVRRR